MIIMAMGKELFWCLGPYDVHDAENGDGIAESIKQNCRLIHMVKMKMGNTGTSGK